MVDTIRRAMIDVEKDGHKCLQMGLDSFPEAQLQIALNYLVNQGEVKAVEKYAEDICIFW